jgi:hypothetical protein
MTLSPPCESNVWRRDHAQTKLVMDTFRQALRARLARKQTVEQ